MKLSTFALLAAGAAGLTGPTLALAAEGVATERVAYSDLNLASDAGVEQLYARLRKAAVDVCGSPGIRELKAYVAANACAARTLADAVEQVHSAKLSARHQLGSASARVAVL
jgi:UrcA family protein